jgi:hypothetical protein
VGEACDDIVPTVYLIFGRCRPVDFWMQQPRQVLPPATLDGIEHVAYHWNLVCHVYEF